MSTLEWHTAGIGPISVLCSIFLIFIFRTKQFGYLDPLSLYLATRAGPTLASVILMLSVEAITSYFFILTIVSVIVFITTLYLVTPRLTPSAAVLDELGIKKLFHVAIALSIIKIAIFYTASGSLPVFGESGSDSYIGFAEDNKLGSSFLLAVGSSELILLSCLIGVTKGTTRLTILLLLILSIAMHLAGGKKSSLLGILLALALGEYLRMQFTSSKKRFFTSLKVLGFIFTAAILWAGFIFEKTSGYIELPESNAIITILDLVLFQWAYPTYLFLSNELSAFFDIYDVNRLLYFFHTALSPLGFPAFSASIGPALHEYQTGYLSGNGINPTYLIEGYVLLGNLLPLYSLLVALIIGKARKCINNLRDTRTKILCYALFLPAIYIIPIDALLFMKILIALLLLSPGLLLIFRTYKK
jgi:hypothetical protein